jgi:4,5-DOPA dioxygenase extradiol
VEGRQPLLFLSHGSPTNAVEDNDFTRALDRLGSSGALGHPRAILCISAHWLEESGPVLCSGRAPGLIYDFYGFPPELYRVSWPAKGSPELAGRVAGLLSAFSPRLDPDRGFDHGAWTVLMRLFPDAGPPLVQLSLDPGLPASRQLELARALAPLRDEGVMIVGSGNATHNLGEISWASGARPPAWALSFDALAAASVSDRDIGALAEAVDASRAGRLRAHPSVDHLLPLLYAAALAAPGEKVGTVYEGWQNGSLSMRSIAWGL